MVLAILLAATGAGCGSTDQPGPRAIEGVFPAQGDVAELPVRVSDLDGLISTVAIVAPDGLAEGVSQVAGRDDALHLQWIGGMCDRSALVVVDQSPDGVVVTVSTERDFGGCRMKGIPRTLRLELHHPVDLSTVRLDLRD